MTPTLWLYYALDCNIYSDCLLTSALLWCFVEFSYLAICNLKTELALQAL